MSETLNIYTSKLLKSLYNCSSCNMSFEICIEFYTVLLCLFRNNIPTCWKYIDKLLSTSGPLSDSNFEANSQVCSKKTIHTLKFFSMFIALLDQA